MKIDEKMIEQMTEEEQQELYNLIQKQQRRKKKQVAENLVKEMCEIINKMIDEDFVFKYTNNSKNYEDFYSVLSVEAQDDGETILLTFYE
jgi:hypothetical protein